jgi:hypothetical protein
VDEVRDEGKGVFVRDCPFVEIPVVLDWLELAIFLFDQEES